MSVVGTTIGNLDVLEYLGYKPVGKTIHHYYRVLCACGKFFDVTRQQLQSGIRSCGCLRNQQTIINNKLRTLPKDEALWSRKFRSYKRGADVRSLSFDLSLEQFREIISMPCVFCGAKPSKWFDPYGTGRFILITGIDRIDSSLGYSADNIQACCRVCNSMKKTLSDEEFITQVERIYKHLDRA